MSILKQILLQRSNGINLQTISKSLNISPNTVKKYLRLIEGRGYDMASLLELDEEALESLLNEPDLPFDDRQQILVICFPILKKSSAHRC